MEPPPDFFCPVPTGRRFAAVGATNEDTASRFPNDDETRVLRQFVGLREVREGWDCLKSAGGWVAVPTERRSAAVGATNKNNATRYPNHDGTTELRNYVGP